MIKKPLAGVVAGVLLVGGGALATAQADHNRTHESGTDSNTAANERMQEPTLQPRLAAGEDYSADPSTTTSLRVPGRVQYGSSPQARVSVGTATGTVRGRVEVGIDGVWGTERLRNGSTTVGLPRDLQPDWTYTVRANYLPGRNDYQGSRDTARMKVIKANSRARVDAPNRSPRQRPRVATTVTTDTGVPARGRVRVTISKGRNDKARTVRLRGGDAVARFPRVRRGLWDVRVVYTGSNTVQADVARDSFRRTRR